MIMRRLKKEDLNQARLMWVECFDDHPAFVDWYFRERFRPEEGLGVFSAKRAGSRLLLANLHLAPYHIAMRKKVYPSAYLIGLATKPQYRKMGLAKKLLSFALGTLAENRTFVTFLMPFNIKFYTRLGWGVFSRRRIYRSFGKESFVFYEKGNKGNIKKINGSDFKPLDAVYSIWSASFDGYLIRKENDWKGLLFDHFLDGGEVWLHSNLAGIPQAYAMTLVENNKLTLREIAYTNINAGRAILYRLIEAAGVISVWTAPEVEPLLPSSMTPGSLSPVMLGRITDVPGMLNKTASVLTEKMRVTGQSFEKSWKKFLSTGISFSVTDPLIPANNGTFILYITKSGALKVIKGNPHKNGNSDRNEAVPRSPGIRCTVGKLFELVSGTLDPVSDASPEFTANDKRVLSILKELFPPAVNYTNDFF